MWEENFRSTSLARESSAASAESRGALRDLFRRRSPPHSRNLQPPEEILERQPVPGTRPRRSHRKARRPPPVIRRHRRHRDQAAGHYREIGQSFAVSVKSVGVMGDQRTYAYGCAIRAVHPEDGNNCRLGVPVAERSPKRISNRVVNEICGINRVVYDITSKHRTPSMPVRPLTSRSDRFPLTCHFTRCYCLGCSWPEPDRGAVAVRIPRCDTNEG